MLSDCIRRVACLPSLRDRGGAAIIPASKSSEATFRICTPRLFHGRSHAALPASSGLRRSRSRLRDLFDLRPFSHLDFFPQSAPRKKQKRVFCAHGMREGLLLQELPFAALIVLANAISYPHAACNGAKIHEGRLVHLCHAIRTMIMLTKAVSYIHAAPVVTEIKLQMPSRPPMPCHSYIDYIDKGHLVHQCRTNCNRDKITKAVSSICPVPFVTLIMLTTPSCASVLHRL